MNRPILSLTMEHTFPVAQHFSFLYYAPFHALSRERLVPFGTKLRILLLAIAAWYWGVCHDEVEYDIVVDRGELG